MVIAVHKKTLADNLSCIMYTVYDRNLGSIEFGVLDNGLHLGSK